MSSQRASTESPKQTCGVVFNGPVWVAIEIVDGVEGIPCHELALVVLHNTVGEGGNNE